MAISKTRETQYGGSVNTTHHVIDNIKLDRTSSTVRITLLSYVSDTEYDNNDQAVSRKLYSFNFSDVPASVTTKMIELRDIIELEMINNLGEWSGGIQVND